MIKLSVCIPVYGVEKYIERCARSLFEQTQKDSIEFIFINDCTPDKSIEILRIILNEYPERAKQVKIIEHKKNSGIGAARLTGMSAAQGEYLIYCDSDDYVSTRYCELLLKKGLESDSDVVICDYDMDYGDSKIPIVIPNEKDPKKVVVAMLKGKIHCGVWNKMVKMELYRSCGSVFEEGIDMWEDVNIVIPIINEAKSISYVNESLYYYYQQNTSSYTHKVKEKSLNNMIDVTNRLDRYFTNKNPKLLPELNYLKLTVRLNYLLNTTGRKQQEGNNLYREADKSIMNYEKMSMFWRLALKTASYKQLWLFNFFKAISKMFGK